MKRQTRFFALVLALALLVPAGALGASLHERLIVLNGAGTIPDGFARTADGVLHLVFETNTNWGNSANGVGAASITPSGQLGPQVQALTWTGVTGGSPSGIPGLAVMPGGALQAVFGGSPNGDPGPWGITSTNGGSTWSGPADIGSGSMEAGDGNMTLQVSQGTPVFTAGCCGGIVIQRGFGPGSPTYQLTSSANNAAGNTASAVDAATGAVIAGWRSNAGAGGLWFQQVAPSAGAPQALGDEGGALQQLVVAGRDSGPGVFAASSTSNALTSQIRLYRYGGGSVAVGAVKGLHAVAVGVATGLDGRIWVFWHGSKNGRGITAVTRSNKAVTRFEPLQLYSFNWAYLFLLAGDGRLGPLDLLANGSPVPPAGHPLVQGIYWARVLPELSATLSVQKLGKGKFKLKAHVTDAGDPLSGATVSAQGKQAKTSSKGNAALTVTGSSHSRVSVNVSAPGYRGTGLNVKL